VDGSLNLVFDGRPWVLPQSTNFGDQAVGGIVAEFDGAFPAVGHPPQFAFRAVLIARPADRLGLAASPVNAPHATAVAVVAAEHLTAVDELHPDPPVRGSTAVRPAHGCCDQHLPVG